MVKYLGLDFDAAGITQTSCEKLREHLLQLRKAPLKPQQPLYLLRTNVIPGVLNTLVLGRCGRTTLRRIDQQVRREVQAWFHLPNDTTDAFIHTSVRGGELDIVELSFIVPLHRTTKLNNLRISPYPPVRQLTGSPLFRRLVQKSRPAVRNEHLLDSRAAIRGHFHRALIQSVDGAGLKVAAVIPAANEWVRSPSHRPSEAPNTSEQ